MQLIRNILQLFLHPVTTLRRLTLGRPGPVAWTVLLGTIVSLAFNHWADLPDKNWSITAAFISSFLIKTIFIFIFLVLWVAVIHLTADILGGAGRGLNLFYFTMLSTLPFWLLIPFVLINKILFNLSAVHTGVLLILLCWTLILAFISVKELYRFNFGKTFLVFLIPVLVMSAISIIFLKMSDYQSIIADFVNRITG